MESSNFQKARRQLKQIHNAQQLITPFAGFTHLQAAGGILLLICTVIAILCANIPALEPIHKIWDTDFSLSFDYNFLPLRTVGEWVNNVLMVIFFFYVGLEIKREMAVGELSSVRNALLPVFAALGGMVVPALIYHSINAGTAGEAGWGIPMATDIAFTIGILFILGNRVPSALKVFLTALVIVENLGAIVVMSISYPHALNFGFLAAAVATLVALIVLNRLRINRTFPYVSLGILLWFFMLRSGVHATVAGIALAMTIPSNIKINQIRFYVRSKYMIERFRDAYSQSTPLIKNELEQQQINNLATEIRNATPLIMRLEHALHPWIVYFIMPAFALANAGITINAESFSMLTSGVSIGIFLGLLVGKPIGVVVMSFLAVKFKIAVMPDRTRWSEIIGVGILAGIGFTMSIFINTIAFGSPSELAMQNTGKLSILISSVCAGIIGLIYMNRACKKNQ